MTLRSRAEHPVPGTELAPAAAAAAGEASSHPRRLQPPTRKLKQGPKGPWNSIHEVAPNTCIRQGQGQVVEQPGQQPAGGPPAAAEAGRGAGALPAGWPQATSTVPQDHNAVPGPRTRPRYRACCNRHHQALNREAGPAGRQALALPYESEQGVHADLRRAVILVVDLTSGHGTGCAMRAGAALQGNE